MTYKLDPEVRKITSPIILSFSDGREDQQFPNGASLADAVFCKNYLIEALSAQDGSVVLAMRENDQVNAVDFAGEGTVEMNFF